MPNGLLHVRVPQIRTVELPNNRIDDQERVGCRRVLRGASGVLPAKVTEL